MLTKGPHKVGLRALFEAAGLTGKTIDSYHIGFMVAPRINAAGRMSTPDIATRLLLASDEGMADEAKALAEQLEAENTRRRAGRSGHPRQGQEDRRNRSRHRLAQRAGRRRRRLASRRHRHRRLEARRRVLPAGDRAVDRRRHRARLVPQHPRLQHAGRARILRAADEALRRPQGGGRPATRDRAHQGVPPGGQRARRHHASARTICGRRCGSTGRWRSTTSPTA